MQLGNIKYIRAYCNNRAVILTQGFDEILVHQAMAGLSMQSQARHEVVFYGSNGENKVIYFFIPRYICHTAIPEINAWLK